MTINNINTEEIEIFVEKVKANPQMAVKGSKVIGEWNFIAGQPQFKTTLDFKKGSQKTEVDLAPFMGGQGLSPDPMQYYLLGTASCYAGAFVSLAAAEGIELKKLRVAAENEIDLSRTIGVSQAPIVNGVKITLEVESSAAADKIAHLKDLALQRSLGVYCLSSQIPLQVDVRRL